MYIEQFCDVNIVLWIRTVFRRFAIHSVDLEIFLALRFCVKSIVAISESQKQSFFAVFWGHEFWFWSFSALNKCKNSSKSLFKASKCVKMVVIALVESLNLFSRKICVIEKLWNFHTAVQVCDLLILETYMRMIRILGPRYLSSRAKPCSLTPLLVKSGMLLFRWVLFKVVPPIKMCFAPIRRPPSKTCKLTKKFSFLEISLYARM